MKIKQMFLGLLFLPLLIMFGCNNYASPEEALENVKEPSWEMQELIDTRVLESEDYAYVFFYSELDNAKDTLVISELEKGNSGWKHLKMVGLSIKEGNANGSTSVGGVEDGIYYGLATNDVASVKLGYNDAEIIPLTEKNMKAWVFYNPTFEDLEKDLKFNNANGDLLTKYD